MATHLQGWLRAVYHSVSCTDRGGRLATGPHGRYCCAVCLYTPSAIFCTPHLTMRGFVCSICLKFNRNNHRFRSFIIKSSIMDEI